MLTSNISFLIFNSIRKLTSSKCKITNMSIETIGDRIRRVRKELKLTQKQVASSIGVTPTSIVFWERNETTPKGKNLLSLCKKLRVDPHWLETGKGDRNQNNVAPVSDSHSSQKSFPVISMVSAGAWMEAIEPYPRESIEETMDTTEKVSEQSFWVKVVGDSMTTPSGLSFPDGMYILIDPQEEARNKSFVVAKLKDENVVTFKQLIMDAGSNFLKPLNPSPMYAPIPINGNCKIIGVVVDAKWKLR